MQSWNNVIQTAMLGTEKKQMDLQEIPEDIARIMQPIINNITLDKEENSCRRFYRI
ncbi:MAG: hypothetical protein WKI04_08735 [Ferruginibacter sp.]